PVVTEPPVKPIVSPTPVPIPAPAPMPVPTPVPRPQEGGERRPAKKRKIARSILAGLALLGSTYAAGRLHENYIIKSHDTPAVDSINKMQDNTRNLPVDMQEEMASNYERTQDFFEGISTKVGAEDFKNFEKMYTDTINELTAKHGSSLTKERIEELAQKKVIAQLAALDLHQAEASISK
ncbi:hypothetical protein KC974_02710, partial [Candidatus Saccharibacteria bacterium]|nr:hypothetical protein [Candidatus Saccharibacteria bacterium]